MLGSCAGGTAADDEEVPGSKPEYGSSSHESDPAKAGCKVSPEQSRSSLSVTVLEGA